MLGLGKWPLRQLPTRERTPDMCHGQKSRFIGDGHPTFNRNPYNGYINPYYWVDDHPLLYGNNGSLDPSTHIPPMESRKLIFPTTLGWDVSVSGRKKTTLENFRIHFVIW